MLTVAKCTIVSPHHFGLIPVKISCHRWQSSKIECKTENSWLEEWSQLHGPQHFSPILGMSTLFKSLTTCRRYFWPCLSLVTSTLMRFRSLTRSSDMTTYAGSLWFWSTECLANAGCGHPGWGCLCWTRLNHNRFKPWSRILLPPELVNVSENLHGTQLYCVSSRRNFEPLITEHRRRSQWVNY